MSHTLSMVEGNDIYEHSTETLYLKDLSDLKTKNKCINAGLIIAILRN